MDGFDTGTGGLGTDGLGTDSMMNGGFSTGDLIAVGQSMMLTYLVLIVIGTAVGSYAASAIAHYARRKGRSFGAFYWFSLANALAAVAVVISVSPTHHVKTLVVCPNCDDFVSAHATTCNHCAGKLEASPEVTQGIPARFAQVTAQIKKFGIIFAASGAGAAILGILMTGGDLTALGLLFFVLGALSTTAGVGALATLPYRSKTLNVIAYLGEDS